MKNIKDLKLILLDMDGTIYLGNKEIKGAFNTIRILKEKGYIVNFFTNNSSKSSEVYKDKLEKMGLCVKSEDIVTSGQVTADYILENYVDKSVYIVGTDALYDEFKSAGIKLNCENPDIVVLGYDTTLTYEKLNLSCRFIRNGAKYIATHPDFVCPSDLGDMPDVGSFIELIKATTGRIPELICGKPNFPSADYLKKKYCLKSQEIAMIGDRVYTDIKFGIDNDFISILVLSGETDKVILDKSGLKPNYVFKDINEILNFI